MADAPCTIAVAKRSTIRHGFEDPLQWDFKVNNRDTPYIDPIPNPISALFWPIGKDRIRKSFILFKGFSDSENSD